MSAFQPIDDAGIARIESLREALGEHVIADYLARHPAVADSAALRARCREDLGYHYATLLPVLRAGDPAPFVRYAGWLRGVLASRDLPLDHFAESLAAMRDFLCRALPDMAGAIDRPFADALAALVGGSPSQIVPPRPGLPEAPQLTRALLASDRRGAEQLVAGSLGAGQTATAVNVGLLQASLYEIGDLWQRNRITVAHEHLATAMVQNLLTRTYAQAEFAPPLARKAVFACVPGNHHELGLRMVSDAFEFAGWDCRFLGGDTPLPALLAMVDAEKPELVALSVSMPGQVETLRSAIDALHAETGSRCPPILAGGLALNLDESLARRGGADVHAADALDAEALARQ